MTIATVIKTIGSTGVFSTPQLWDDGGPADLVSSERSSAGTFSVAAFIQGESLTFVSAGADPIGKFLDTDSTGPGTGTYITYGLVSGNVAVGDVCTGDVSGATCLIGSSTPLDVGIIWQGHCQNQEFSNAATVVTIVGSTDSAAAYKDLTTAPGASFRDNVNVQTNALLYNSANGCGFKTVGFLPDRVVVEASDGLSDLNCRISKIQLKNIDTSGGPGSGGCLIIGSVGIFENLIVEGQSVDAGATKGTLVMLNNAIVRNTLVVQRQAAADHVIGTGAGTASPSFYNVTVVAPDDLLTAPNSIFSGAGSGTITAQNCDLFAGDSTKAIKSGTGTYNFTTCYSDISGTSGVTQTTYANEFENVNDATRDFRLKIGAAGIDTGTTDPTNAQFDIAGTARPNGAAYDVGCWELVQGAAVPMMGQECL